MWIWSNRNWRLLSKRGETRDFAPPAMRIESAWKTWIRLSSLRNAGSKRASKHQITTASQVYISRGELKCMIFCIHAPLNTDGQRHGPQARAYSIENCVAHSRGDAHDGRLACAHGGQVFSVENLNFNLGHIPETRHWIIPEVRIEYAPILKMNGLKQRPANPLNNGAGDLVPQPVWIDDCAAIERLHYPQNFDIACGAICDDFSTSCKIGAFFKASGNPNTVAGSRTLPGPAELPSRGLKHRA